MRDRHETAHLIGASGVIGIVRASATERATQLALTLLDAGLPAVEVSLTTPGALSAISAAAARGKGVVGAGTVLDAPSVVAAISAGARFIVSPVLSADVIRTARRYGAVVLPGVGTATEALHAIELGADFAKLFPASAYGHQAIADMLVALPQIPLVPTGGILLSDAPAYIGAGSAAVGLGSALSAGTPDEIGARVQTLLASIRAARP